MGSLAPGSLALPQSSFTLGVATERKPVWLPPPCRHPPPALLPAPRAPDPLAGRSAACATGFCEPRFGLGCLGVDLAKRLGFVRSTMTFQAPPTGPFFGGQMFDLSCWICQPTACPGLIWAASNGLFSRTNPYLVLMRGEGSSGLLLPGGHNRSRWLS